MSKLDDLLEASGARTSYIPYVKSGIKDLMLELLGQNEEPRIYIKGDDQVLAMTRNKVRNEIRKAIEEL